MVAIWGLQTQEKIYLVLEYCDGGDLAAYINRYERVSKAVARHFMRQLGMSMTILTQPFKRLNLILRVKFVFISDLVNCLFEKKKNSRYKFGCLS